MSGRNLNIKGKVAGAALSKEQVLRYKEFKDIVNWLDEYSLLQGTIVYLSFACALRITEAVHLRIEDFRYLKSDNFIVVLAAKKRRRSRKESLDPKNRVVYKQTLMADDVPEVISRIEELEVDIENGEGWFLPGRNGPNGRRPMSERRLREIFDEAAIESGVGHRKFHSLRHMAGLMVAQATGGNLIAVRDFLRHEDTKTAEIYVKMTEDEKIKFQRSIRVDRSS